MAFVAFWKHALHKRKKNHTNTARAVLLPTKSSSDDDSGFRHGFGAEASLPLTQSAPAVSHDTTRLCWFDLATWVCQIQADADSTLSWISFLNFLLSEGDKPRFERNADVELAINPRHPTSTGNTVAVQPFLVHCSLRSSYFSSFL